MPDARVGRTLKAMGSATGEPAGTTKARLITVDPASFDRLPCCGIKDSSHPGRLAKRCWLAANASCGLCAKTVLGPDGKPAGYLESVPGEFAWRGVEAPGYLFIHCLWIYARRNQRQGWGRFLIESCLAEAKSARMKGVAVIARDGPWMADRRLFEANGFACVDTAPPDYQLLVRKFAPSAANPTFRQGGDRRLAQFGRGLTIIRSGQCPYIAKFAAEIAGTAEEEYGIVPNVVDLQSCREAQNAPTPYAVFAVIYNGKLVADHQISRTRFRNIMHNLVR